MKAMVLDRLVNLSQNSSPLRMAKLPLPIPKKDEVLVKISRCGVCHTELDEIEGRTPPAMFPVILGHQVVGKIAATGENAKKFTKGERVGIAWIFSACGQCGYCKNGNENLCENFKATGRDAHGGYAEYITVSEKFAYKIPEVFSDSEAAPLLCAGAIGYRSLCLTGIKNGELLGLMGFGSSAHLVLKMVRHKFPGTKIYVFARNAQERNFALELGATWAGDIEDVPPQKLHAIIDTTPAWKPAVKSMENLLPGGRLVINAIRKEEKDKNSLLNIDYPRHLWMEKEIKSVANITRHDVEEFLQLAAEIPIKPVVEEYELENANQALTDLKNKNIHGAKVLVI